MKVTDWETARGIVLERDPGLLLSALLLSVVPPILTRYSPAFAPFVNKRIANIPSAFVGNSLIGGPQLVCTIASLVRNPEPIIVK